MSVEWVGRRAELDVVTVEPEDGKGGPYPGKSRRDVLETTPLSRIENLRFR